MTRVPFFLGAIASAKRILVRVKATPSVVFIIIIINITIIIIIVIVIINMYT